MDVLFVGNNWDGTADVINVKNYGPAAAEAALIP